MLGPRLALLAALVLPGQGLKAAALDLVFVAPSTVASGGTLTIELQVRNNLSATAQAVTPAFGVQSGSASWSGGPSPASYDIASGVTRGFTWTYLALDCGSLIFSAQASGWDSGAGVTVTSFLGNSTPLSVTCPATATPTPVVTATPTSTETPWIIYTTPTVVPGAGDAGIYGNLFKLDSGRTLDLRYSVPFDSKVTISLYNRLGQRIRRIERQVSAGSYSEPWDGRSDSGSLAAAGIYVALFQGKGLYKQVKFAVIR